MRVDLPKLGIIAGNDDLPRCVIERCRKINRPYFVLAFKGQTDPQTLDGSDHAWVRLGAVGKALGYMRVAGVEELVLAGGIRRPSWTELRPDRVGAKWLAKLAKHARGDDSIFRILTAELEKEGFRVIGVEDIIGDEILASAGASGAHRPDEQAEQDIARGLEIATHLGRADVGQSVIVQQGIVLGVEAVEGTNALIKRCAELRRPGPGGVLIKIAKPGQERRVDLPTIGSKTVRLTVASGLRGIAVEAGGVQILDKSEVIRLADEHGIFLAGVSCQKSE
ncbi:MAG: UDP-2,3-diacylglucosamine diphosphatase LpxI, partial [Pseudomonadota bacterium]